MEEKRPIAALISYYQASEYGGFYKYVHQLIESIAECGVKVHLVVKRDKNLSKLEKLPNIFIHYINTHRKALFALYSIFMIIKITIKFRIQIFHSHGVDEGVLNNIIKSVFRRKQIVSIRVNWWTWLKVRKENSKRIGRLIFSLYLIISPILIRRADALIITNKYLQKTTSKISKGKPALLKYNTIKTDMFDPDQIATSLKNDISVTGYVVMYVGRLLPYKGAEYLIKAITYVKEIHPDVLLILIGDGSQKIFLERLVEQEKLLKNVLFAGYQRNIAEWLSITDVFVLPSLTEGSSNALLEAMSMRLPVIATRVGSAPDIIKHLQNGLLVEPKNAKQIAEYINILLENRVLANKIGKNARNTVIKNFSQFAVCDILAFYDKLLGFDK